MSYRAKHLAIAVLALLFVFPYTVSAQSEEERAISEQGAQEDPFDLFGPEMEAELEQQSKEVTQQINSLADYIDSFFVSDRVNEFYGKNRLRIRAGVTFDDRGGVDFSPRLQLNLALPRLKNKVSVLLSTLTDEPGEETTQEILQPNDYERVNAGLRFFLLDLEKHQVNLDGGFRMDPQPDPSIRLRYLFEAGSPIGLLRPAEVLFWTMEEGYGSRTRLDIDNEIGEGLLYRNTVQLIFSEETVNDEEGTNFDYVLALYHTLSRRRAMRWSGGVRGYTDPSATADEFFASCLYRQAFFKRVLFYELEPAVRWEEDHDYEPSFEITFRLEMNFSNEALERHELPELLQRR